MNINKQTIYTIIGGILIIMLLFIVILMSKGLNMVIPDELYINGSNLTNTIENTICHPDNGGLYYYTIEEDDSKLLQIICRDITDYNCKLYEVDDDGNSTDKGTLLCCNLDIVLTGGYDINLTKCPECFSEEQKTLLCEDNTTIITKNCIDSVFVDTNNTCPVVQQKTNQQKCEESDGSWLNESCQCNSIFKLVDNVCIEMTDKDFCVDTEGIWNNGNETCECSIVPLSFISGVGCEDVKDDEPSKISITSYVLIFLVLIVILIGVILTVKYVKRR